MTAPVSQVATRVYATYREAALRQIGLGRWTSEEVERRLRPWAAVTLLCGGHVPGVSERLKDMFRPVVYYPGGGAPAQYDRQLPEQDVRDHLAGGLCATADWRAALSRGCTDAIARAEPASTPQAEAQALDLAALARALGVTIIPPRHRQQERLAA